MTAYRPEAVLARSVEDQPIAAHCDMLPATLAATDPNPEYAARLQEALRAGDSPAAYIASVGGA